MITVSFFFHYYCMSIKRFMFITYLCVKKLGGTIFMGIVYHTQHYETPNPVTYNPINKIQYFETQITVTVYFTFLLHYLFYSYMLSLGLRLRLSLIWIDDIWAQYRSSKR